MSSETQSKQRGKIQPLKTVELSEYQKDYYQIYMYKPHTPCKLQRWSSAQSASSGLFDPSASSVHCLTGSLHAHVFPKMLRIPALDHSGRFVCSVSPPCVLLSLDSRRGWKCSWTDGLNSTVAKNCREFFGFGARTRFFFWKKIPYVAIFYCLGWLVGCDLVLLLETYVTQKR